MRWVFSHWGYLKTTMYSDLFTASFCLRFKSMFRQESQHNTAEAGWFSEDRAPPAPSNIYLDNTDIVNPPPSPSPHPSPVTDKFIFPHIPVVWLSIWPVPCHYSPGSGAINIVKWRTILQNVNRARTEDIPCNLRVSHWSWPSRYWLPRGMNAPAAPVETV